MAKRDRGRPTKYEDGKMHAVYLPVSLVQWGKRESKRRGISFSEFLVELLLKEKGRMEL